MKQGIAKQDDHISFSGGGDDDDDVQTTNFLMKKKIKIQLSEEGAAGTATTIITSTQPATVKINV